MSTNDKKKQLSTLMADLQEEALLELVSQQITDGVDSLEIINQCHKGMTRVGERYEQGEYFISGLIMAGEIMHQVGQRIFPLFKNRATNGDAGRIILGTVEGDIHFIGKDIFKVLIRGYGFTVHDLGVDVPPNKFLSAIHEFKPDIVGLSCLISAAFKTMQKTIAYLKENTPQTMAPRAYIIGGRVDALVAKNSGASYWTDDAMKGVQLCLEIMKT
jgi:methanogenic corrinoid protein MtbC1